MSSRKTLSGKEVLVLLLYLPGKSGDIGEAIIGRTRLIKMMFLFAKEVQPQLRKKGFEFSLPDFAPYDYGPFSPDVLNDIETLRALNLLEIDSVDESEPFDLLDNLNEQEYEWGAPGVVERQFMDLYRITEKGKGFSQDVLRPKFISDEWKMLQTFKVRCNNVSLTALLRYLYTRYPNYTANSKIRDRVLKYETLAL